MATRYRLFVVDMAERKIEDFKADLAVLQSVRVLTIDPIEVVPNGKSAKQKRPKPRLGTGDKLGEVPHAPSGMTVEGEPRRSVMLCTPCGKGKCAACYYPLDCPCASPMHNGAPFERLTDLEALTL